MSTPRHQLRPQTLSIEQEKRFALTPFALAILLIVGVNQTAYSQTPGTSSAPVAISIAAQPLSQALTELAQQTGTTLVAAPGLLDGKKAPAVSGSMTAQQGLQRLLAGSGLIGLINGGVMTVQVAPTVSDSTLAVVTVTAEAERDGTTEGTSSYTTSTTTTATKLDLSMRETPQSTTVITRQRMDDQAMLSIVDVVQATPGIFVSSSEGVGRPNFSSRGFSADVMYEGFTSPWHAIIPNSQAGMALYDRVEVVRGATGISQGAGNPSAAINMLHKRPTRDFQGSISSTVGSWSDYGAAFDISGPINKDGSIRARFVAAGQDTKTFRDVEHEKHGAVYGVIEADLTNSTLFTLGVDRQTDYTNHFWYDLPISNFGQHLGLPRSTFIGNDWEYSKNRATSAFSTLSHKINNKWTLKLSTLQSWRDVDLLGTALYRDAPESFYQSVWGGNYNSRQQNYDASLSGEVDAFGRVHKILFGATHQSLVSSGPDYSYEPSAIYGVNIYSFNPYQSVKPTVIGASDASLKTTQDSAYAMAQINPLERLKLLIGGRLDWYKYSGYSGDDGYKVSANVTRYAGVTFDVDENHSVYASYTDIFTPQSAKDINKNIIKPIVGENYEIGVKGSYFSGALNASLAYFQVDQKNRARTLDDQSVCPTYPSIYCSEATGLVRTKGVDLEIQGAVTPNWQIGGGYTYSDTRFIKDAVASRIGARFSTNTPQNLFKISTMYKLSGAMRGFRVGGSVYWQSRIYSDGATSGVSWTNSQSSYSTTNFIVGYKPDNNWDFQLNINNIFDKNYYKAIGYNVNWGSTDIYGEPRKIKLTAKYSF
nr:TonB-dependent siderophore receptor [Comamonas koreensis]